MKERGIIFSGPMVRANLEGRKSQTRRTRGLNRINENPDRWVLLHNMSQNANNVWVNRVWFQEKKERIPVRYPVSCPYGVVGDRFYMRETLKLWPGTIATYADGEQIPSPMGANQEWLNNYTRSTVPSIRMPKWAARPERFEITDIRVERVQDISLEDCKAEGVSDDPRENWRELFMELWDSINAKRGYGWESNPWVWVISYRKL